MEEHRLQSEVNLGTPRLNCLLFNCLGLVSPASGPGSKYLLSTDGCCYYRRPGFPLKAKSMDTLELDFNPGLFLSRLLPFLQNEFPFEATQYVERALTLKLSLRSPSQPLVSWVDLDTLFLLSFFCFLFLQEGVGSHNFLVLLLPLLAS